MFVLLRPRQLPGKEHPKRAKVVLDLETEIQLGPLNEAPNFGPCAWRSMTGIAQHINALLGAGLTGRILCISVSLGNPQMDIQRSLLHTDFQINLPDFNVNNGDHVVGL